MIKGFPSAFGSGNGYTQIFFYPGLSNKIIQTARSETGVQYGIFVDWLA
jgi:hypothetical protein